MQLDLSKVWESDEELRKHFESFCHIADIIRGPSHDEDASRKYLFEQLVFFVKQNKHYFDKMMDQIQSQEEEDPGS